MTTLPTPVAAAFIPAMAALDEEVETVDRANVTRSEALALVDLLWEDVEKWRALGAEPYCDSTLSFSRSDDEFIEFSMWHPNRLDARFRYLDKRKLLWLIPMSSTEDLHLVFTTREEVAEFAETYLATPDPRRFRDFVRQRGPTRFRTDQED